MAMVLEGKALTQFLTQGTRTAKLAVAKRDGAPLVSPVWFVMDEDDIVFTTMNSTLKYQAMRREPMVSVCVASETFPYGFASIQGRASLYQLPHEELLEWTTKIARRYVPSAQANTFGERNAVEGEILVRVTPLSIFAYAGIAE